jgi:hypothetical protein
MQNENPETLIGSGHSGDFTNGGREPNTCILPSSNTRLKCHVFRRDSWVRVVEALQLTNRLPIWFVSHRTRAEDDFAFTHAFGEDIYSWLRRVSVSGFVSWIQRRTAFTVWEDHHMARLLVIDEDTIAVIMT